MADRSVTVRFRTREEDYLERNPDGTLAGFNSRGEPLRARLEIDTDKTSGSEPYKLVFNVAQNKWVGQNVFLKYSSNADPGTPIVVRATNGTALLVAENLVSEERTETLVFTNESEKQLSGISSGGSVSTEWVGSVLTAGSPDGDAASLCAGAKEAAGPNVTFDGESLRIPDAATGVLKVTYHETFARIKSNAAEFGTVVVAVCQGRLAEAEQYEVEYTQTSWTGNPDSECCQEGQDQALTIAASFSRRSRVGHRGLHRRGMPAIYMGNHRDGPFDQEHYYRGGPVQHRDRGGGCMRGRGSESDRFMRDGCRIGYRDGRGVLRGPGRRSVRMGGRHSGCDVSVGLGGGTDRCDRRGPPVHLAGDDRERHRVMETFGDDGPSERPAQYRHGPRDHPGPDQRFVWRDPVSGFPSRDGVVRRQPGDHFPA